MAALFLWGAVVSSDAGTVAELEKEKGYPGFLVMGFGVTKEKDGLVTLTVYGLTQDPRKVRDRDGAPMRHWRLFSEDADLLRVLNQHVRIMQDPPSRAHDAATYVKGAGKEIVCEIAHVLADGRVTKLESAVVMRVNFVK